MFLEIIYLICLYQKDLELSNLQWLICRKTKQNQSTIFEFIASNYSDTIIICILYD